jgi:hypothetical protein
MSAFEYLNSINFTKKNLMRDSENDDLAEKSYSPFLVNRSLSYHQDTLSYANEMNACYHIDNKLQFEFLLNIVRPRKRFAKWEKKRSDGDIAIVKEYFGYNDSKALQALEILTTEQLSAIRKKLEKGGRDA